MADFRIFGLIREGVNVVYGALDLLPGFDDIGVIGKVHGDGRCIFSGRGGHFINALHIFQGVFNGQNDTVFHLLRAGPGIGDGDLHLIFCKIGKDLLLDMEYRKQAAHKEDKHEQVGDDRIAGHPGQRAMECG